jgi:hypothetical protein
VKSVFATFVPPGVVTSTLAVPAEVVQVMEVSLSTTTLVAAEPPMVTPIAPVRFVPVMVTLVPPAVLPLDGEIPVTVGKIEMVKVCEGLVSEPPAAVPPLSTAVTVMVATPRLLPGVKVRVPSLAISGCVVKRALLLFITVKLTVWPASAAGPGLMDVAKVGLVCSPEPAATSRFGGPAEV